MDEGIKKYIIEKECDFLLEEWDYKKNKVINENFRPGLTLYWWKCKKEDHSYPSTVRNRVLGVKCGYCAGFRVLPGFNDLLSVKPGIAKCWDYAKNELSPDEVHWRGSKKYWWKCINGHSHYGAIPQSHDYRCKKCNSIGFLAPSYIEEWNWIRNKKLGVDLFNISIGSCQKVWWKCREFGHEWMNSPAKRKSGRNCPFCSCRTLLIGFNDLATRFPQVSLEWDYSKNHPVTPDQVFPGAIKDYWWICQKDTTHSWKSSPNKRTSAGRGCPKCSNSTIEEEVFVELKKEIAQTVQQKRISVPKFRVKNYIVVDYYIEIDGRKIVIEYDGRRWHSSDEIIELDKKKSEILLKMGYEIIRIRDRDLVFLDIKHEKYFEFSHRYEIKNSIQKTVSIITNRIFRNQ